MSSTPPDDPATAATARSSDRYRHLRSWRPGETGNPFGRGISVLGLAAQVRHATGNGKELLAFFMAVMHGEPISRPGRRPLIPNLDQRIAAAQWLADRGWGKAKEIIELASEASPEQRIELLRRLSPQDRDQLRTILAKVLNSTTVPVSDATDGAPALAPPLEKSDSDLPPPDTVT